MRLITLHQKCSSSGLAVLLEQCLPVHTGVLLDTAPKDTMPAPQHQKITASAGLNFTVLHTAHCDTHLGAGVHGEAQLGLLAVVHRQALQQQGARPEPVPPPTALNTRKPCRPVQLSASLRMRSRARSTISLPTAADWWEREVQQAAGSSGRQHGAEKGRKIAQSIHATTKTELQSLVLCCM